MASTRNQIAIDPPVADLPLSESVSLQDLLQLWIVGCGPKEDYLSIHRNPTPENLSFTNFLRHAFYFDSNLDQVP